MGTNEYDPNGGDYTDMPLSMKHQTWEATNWGASWFGLTKLTLLFGRDKTFTFWMVTVGKGFAFAVRCKGVTY